jgi:dienelactone hydrolase
MRKTVVWVILALMLAGVFSGIAVAENTAYPSRGGVQVPATVEVPDGDGPFPLVVLAHGHGGSRQENIGFAAIAEALKAKGIASIRMDFPGCGESTEGFRLNTLSNMKADVLSAIAFAAANYPVDAQRVGIFGYSMGGRIALELISEKAYDFSAAVFLAPAASTENLKGLFGGKDAWDTMKAEAQSNGFVTFTTIYGQTQELSQGWFDDLEAVENPAPAAVQAFTGKALVIYGADDEAVSPSVSQAVADAFGVSATDATGDGHSYGFYSDKTDVLNTVAGGAAELFAEALRR